jgi:ribosomal protein S8
MFICKNLNSEAKRSKLMLNCESSEAKRTCSMVEKIISKRSEHVYIEEFKYRNEANRFDSDFVFKKTKKSELSFFLKTKGKKRKGSIVYYRSFAIPS